MLKHQIDAMMSLTQGEDRLLRTYDLHRLPGEVANDFIKIT